MTLILFVLSWGCSPKRPPGPPLFTDLTQPSGIKFVNTLQATDRLNPYTYRNFFNGGGVSVGDINNDGLTDIYFTGNQVGNRLYLNKGNFVFEDITQTAGVSCEGVWSTGTTMVDVNGDGLLDIYVCKSGAPDVPHRYNELFINNGDLTFTEQAKEFGLDITGLAVQAAFFDYDRDGDLDCYLLTSSFKSIGNFDLIKDQRKIPDPLNAGNKFFRNENGKFVDYTEAAGIYRSAIGFGLGITPGDFNDDGWTDIFISNDFFERDYLYINNQDGSFTEALPEFFPSISMGSMGADFADLNNDGYPELFVTEMLPDSLSRRKTKTVFENWNKYQLNVAAGYHHQFSRNVLQAKLSSNRFAEIGRLAGVAASEWSWGALLFDMDNDGLRDIFVANGIYKDLLDRDYLTFSGAEDNVRRIIKDKQDAILQLIDLMPSSKFSNYAFKNTGNFSFQNRSKAWGLDEEGFSNGSAYADFDNDGDLDLVVNKLNGPSKIYRNNTDTAVNRSLTFSFSAQSSNRFAIGTEVRVYAGDTVFFGDNFLTRGFQSSVEPRIILGLGKRVSHVDSIVVNWPNSSVTRLEKVPVNRTIQLEQPSDLSKITRRSFNRLFGMTRMTYNAYRHRGSGLVDFDRDRLLPMMYSNETPRLITGDLDGDGFDDVYIGGGKDQPGQFFTVKSQQVTWFEPSSLKTYSLSEETKGALFDVDGDHDLDFFMATGGRFFPGSSSALQDHLFINVGKGELRESTGLAAVEAFSSTSTAVPLDFDRDGDLDLAVGERFDPFVYGVGGGVRLLQNDGKGKFQHATGGVAAALSNIGMVTDIEAADMNKDGWMDLVVVGDWMPISIFLNERGSFQNETKNWGLENSSGWWHGISSADVNNDGLPDFAIGNHGKNGFFREGDQMYVNDFDGNGSIEQIYCTTVGHRYFPVAEKDELISQLPGLRKTLLYYNAYAKRAIDDLFDAAVLAKSRVLRVDRLTSAMLMSTSDGYKLVDLPFEAQYAPVYATLLRDVDHDGVADLLVGGNHFLVKPQFGVQDGSDGWFFKGLLSNEKFTFAPGKSLGVTGQIRDIKCVDFEGEQFLLFARYDDEMEIYRID